MGNIKIDKRRDTTRGLCSRPAKQRFLLKTTRKITTRRIKKAWATLGLNAELDNVYTTMLVISGLCALSVLSNASNGESKKDKGMGFLFPHICS